ncbi:porphobilinogen deaminase, dipyromethane cofactor binding domain-containing protein [Powellomyces hirtus]|nr:porphobilinogen deaminase, dipyromethane cofactor binding domain-containing protein [Powellomyces hirtus]
MTATSSARAELQHPPSVTAAAAATTSPPSHNTGLSTPEFTPTATTATANNHNSNTSPERHFVIGTRKSQLAMVQAKEVQAALAKSHPTHTFTIHGMTTKGDKVLDTALSKIGSKSLFTKELEVALADGTVDIVVHSLKDLQTVLPNGMILGAVMTREDPRDALVLSQRAIAQGLTTIESLPPGSVVGSSSVRRIAQLKRRFPHITFLDVRGNLNTRLSKLDDPSGPYTALLLAYAGLHRLGWNNRISHVLPPTTILHAVGQGALGIECRAADAATLDILASLDHTETRLRCTAERAFMHFLEGGCSVPLGVWTELDPETHALRIEGNVSKVDGSVEIKDEVAVTLDPSASHLAHLVAAEQLGERLAQALVDRGAREILDEIKRQRVVLVD